MNLRRWWPERWVVVLAVALWPRLASAYRPFDGTDADVTDLGELELEVGAAGSHQEGSSSFVVAPAAVVNYGFARGFEAVLEGRQDIDLDAARRTSGIQNVALSLKSLLRAGSLQGGHGVSVAVETGLLLPGSETAVGAHVASIFSLRWPALALHLNLGNELFYSVHYQASVGLIMEGPDSWRVRPAAELLVEREFGRVGLYEGMAESFLLGGIGRWNDSLSFDVGLRYGRAEGQHEEEVRLGFTWAFEPW
jgi:hypothetical protein